MRIAKLRIQRFRGFESETFFFGANTVLAGEPRAGRSDVVAALRRVLDPGSTRGRVNPLDIHRPSPGCEAVPLTEVEVTLVDLGNDLAQLLDDAVQAFDPDTFEVAASAGARGAVVGARLCYRAQYDDTSDTGDHWVDYPSKSDPASGTFKRVPRADRDALPIAFIDSRAPLQVRADGTFRELLEIRDTLGLQATLGTLRGDIHGATSSFAGSTEVAGGVGAVFASGARDLLGVPDPVSFTFVPEDGTMAALLRSLQPAVELDVAGELPLVSHGSTTSAIISASEAVAIATARTEGLVIVGDDFGDQLDAASAEHLTFLLQKAASQVILTTRSRDVIRGFEIEDLIRLTRHGGARKQHRLSASTKAKRIARRLGLDQLLGAISAQTAVLVEGPFDAEGYGSLSSRLAKLDGGRELSFAANGMRLVAPPGSDGGITRLQELAELAAELGFNVRAIVDSDKPGDNDQRIEELLTLAEQVVVLPNRSAVEAALVRKLPIEELKRLVEELKPLGMPEMPAGVEDEDLESHIIDSKALKKQGLHAPWVRELSEQPPLAKAVIAAACGDVLGRVDVADV